MYEAKLIDLDTNKRQYTVYIYSFINSQTLITMSSKNLLNALFLRQDTWQGRNRSLRKHTISTGDKNLDNLLLGGWPVSALTELVSQQDGIGELSLLLPTMKHYACRDTLCVWLDPPYQPYAPSLVNAEIPLEQLLVVRSKNSKEWLWAAEQSIRSNAILFAWTKNSRPRYAELRKLQLAAVESYSPAFLFSTENSLKAPSPARLRIGLQTHKANVLSVTLHKLKGKNPGAKTEVILNNLQTERTQLEQLPVNISYPQKEPSTYQLLQNDESQHLNA